MFKQRVHRDEIPCTYPLRGFVQAFVKMIRRFETKFDARYLNYVQAKGASKNACALAQGT